jgi:hypothetical protein
MPFPAPRFAKLPLPLLLWMLITLPASAAQPRLPPALADAPSVSAALNNTLEIAKTGSRTRWESSSGRHGFITINRTWFPKPDQPCREYLRSLVNPDDKPTLMHGVGCRDGNGLWMLLETQRSAITVRHAVPHDSAPRPAPRAIPAAAPVPRRSSSAKTPIKSASTPSTTPASKPSSATASPKPAPIPAASSPAVDPAAAAVIDASRPTPAEW